MENPLMVMAVQEALKQLFSSVSSYFAHFYVDGGAKLPTEEKSVLKIGEEAGELQGAIGKSFYQQEIEDEWADVLFATIHHAIICKYDIVSAIQRSMKKAEERKKTSRVIGGIIVKKEDYDGVGDARRQSTGR